jgi:hypothetical protein
MPCHSDLSSLAEHTTNCTIGGHGFCTGTTFCVVETGRWLTIYQGVLRTGDRATVIFEFIQRPEYLKPGMKLVSNYSSG